MFMDCRDPGPPPRPWNPPGRPRRNPPPGSSLLLHCADRPRVEAWPLAVLLLLAGCEGGYRPVADTPVLIGPP